MKSSPLLVLCMFSFLTAFAEFPLLEESPSSLLPSQLTMEENMELEKSLSLFDEELDDFDEELSALDASIDQIEEKSEILSLETVQRDEKSPVIDIAKPLSSMEENISLQIIEEKILEEIPVMPLQDASAVATSTPEAAIQVFSSKSEEKSALPLEENESTSLLSIESSSSEIKPNLDVQLDLNRAFAGSPFIYTLLVAMSLFSVSIWLYCLLSLKRTANVPKQLLQTLHSNLNGNDFDEALSLCHSHDALLCKMVASGIQSRKYGLSMMVESMKAEGKRSTMGFWQKIGLLNDVAILAPMLGLLGTVLGMFYAFYDVNRSIESITSLFDGLGISVGTTVAGLSVAILALILHSTARYRLIKVLSQIESQAHAATSLIDNHTSLYNESK